MKLRIITFLIVLTGIFFWLVYIFKIEQQNIANFYDLTKQDPLFYDQATDISLLDKSVQSLKEMDTQILKYDSEYRENEGGKYSDVYPQGWRLWPEEFLLTLPSIHEATTLFLNKPTKKNGQKLLQWYEKAVIAYKEAIQLHIEALNNALTANPKLGTRRILFLGSATTPGIVLNDFNIILENAVQLEKEVRERKRCLSVGLCPASRKIVPITQKNTNTVPFRPLKNSVLGIDENQQIFGPYWAETNCFGSIPNGVYSHPFYAVEKKGKNGDKTIVNLMLTNTKYYRDYRKVPNQPVAKLWLRRGVTVRPHSGLNDYLCTDLRFLPELYAQYLRGKGQFTEDSYNSKISTLPFLIQRTLSTSNFLVYELIYNETPFDPLFLLISRSAYSLYFGTFSQTIWRLPETPTFLLSEDFTDSVLKAGYAKYEDLRSEGMSDDEIERLNLQPSVDQMYQEELNLLK